MKASELRLNNLLERNGSIVCLDTNYDLFVALVYVSRSDRKYKPIPLTEEWLLKFGFKKYVSDDIDIDIDFQISFHKKSYEGLIVQLFMDSNGVVFFSHSGISLFSVHHLQNLYFSLTGEELKQQDK
jgi:hypothetical protein